MKHAFRTGKINPKVYEDVMLYILAKEFGIFEDDLKKLSYQYVQKLLDIYFIEKQVEEEQRKKEKLRAKI